MTAKQAWWWVLLLGLLLFLPGIAVSELQSGDETRVAGIAAEMFVEHEYLLPQLDGQPFLEYPPLYYQLTALSYSVFGVNTFAARLPAAIFAIGGMLLVFGFGLKLKFTPGAALFSALLLATGAQYYSYAGKCMVDMGLAFFILLSISGFYSYVETAGKKRFAWLALYALGMAGGIGTKGLLGIALPASVLGCWLLLRDWRERRISWRRYLALGGGAAFGLGAAILWYAAIFCHCGEELFHEAWYVNNFGRFTGSQGDHVEGWYYYLLKLPELFQPWLIVLFAALWSAWRQVRRNSSSSRLLLLLFLLLPFLALSVASSKRIVYLLPLYAACALLCGAFWCDFPMAWRLRLKQWLGRRRFLPLSAARIFLLLTAAALLLTGLNAAYNRWLNEDKSLRPLFAECAALEQSGRRVVLAATAERTRGAAYFYLQHHLPNIGKTSAPPPPGEARVYRADEMLPEGRQFADRHQLVDGNHLRQAAQLGDPTLQNQQPKGQTP